MILAIDFDGTIVETAEYPAFGELREGAKEYINRLYDDGHEIIIWTCRTERNSKKMMYAFLVKNGINFHAVNRNSSSIKFDTYPKIYADVYIDDRQIGGLPSWENIYTLIKTIL
jgi:hydroxymethylpyrimidine pyrophosphatase-like HAD family hydrolase